MLIRLMSGLNGKLALIMKGALDIFVFLQIVSSNLNKEINMSQNQNNLPSVAELLEMSRTQIVAEAFLMDEDYYPEFLHPKNGDYTFRKTDLKDTILRDGNNHTSKLTEPEIKEFMENWEVVAYLPNTTTGFSGTLFEALEDIPRSGAKAVDQMLPFRE